MVTVNGVKMKLLNLPRDLKLTRRVELAAAAATCGARHLEERERERARERARVRECV